MCKSKEDYPIVLTTNHVVEIMDCSKTTAAQYIKAANAELKKRGIISPIDIAKNLRISRDKFFEIYGI